ncbi:MAG: ribose 5-phosphate isomerase A [Calditrichaeota bacterium]|nr:ribose 5-phosphate isomerase A [Calditrichota bacterium]
MISERPKTRDELKQLAAIRALDFVKSDMVLGVGSGSTVYFLLKKLGEKIRSGTLSAICAIPSSLRTQKLAEEFGVPMTDFLHHPRIDLTIDGADEVDAGLNLIKGGGGALLREKILAQNSDRLFIIADETKIVERLGLKFPLPAEVIPFALEPSMSFLKKMGFEPNVRKAENEKFFTTDQGNFIIDFFLKENTDLTELAKILAERAGIVEHGLFLQMADRVIVGTQTGVQIIDKFTRAVE